MTTLVIDSGVFAVLLTLLDEAPLEAAGILFCRHGLLPGGFRLLGEEFQRYEPEDYVQQGTDSLTVSPVAVNRMLQKARAEKLSVVQVHTHPFSRAASFSVADNNGEAEMMPTIFRRVPGVPHGALVLGRAGASARVYRDPAIVEDARVVEVGEHIRRLDRPHEDAVDPRFARSIAGFGREGQAVLRDMRIGIVGLGGTGSIVAEQLSYLGVRDVCLIDPDVVEVSNLNRLVGATSLQLGLPKVSVAAERYKMVEDGATVQQIIGDVIDESVARRLLDRDLVFCCTDSQASRALLNWLSYQFFLPVIDLGVEITPTVDGQVAAISGRIQAVGPGAPCLYCCNVLNADRIRVELMSEEERAHDQYVTGQTIEQPAVISLNGIMSSLAVTMFIGMSTHLPLSARMQIYHGTRGEVRPATASSKDGCPFCLRNSPVFGAGESIVPFWKRSFDSGDAG